MLEQLHNPDVAALLLRVPVGTFFAIRGWQKIFSYVKREGLKKTLTDDHYFAVSFFSWWIPLWEGLAGTLLVLGLCAPLMAAILGLICVMAILTDKLHEVKVTRAPETLCDWTCCLLFLSEVPMGLLLLVSILTGPGRYSLDYLLNI